MASWRHLLVTALAGVFAFLGAVTVFADANSTAIAINTQDNSDVFRLSFKILRMNGDVVSPTNLAFAYSSCSACQTVAISIEAVFVTSDPNVASPTNEAWAINYLCDSCSTLADAYQFYDTTGGNFMITPEGRQEIARIRQALEALRQSNDIAYIYAQVQALTAELQQVLTTQVVPVGNQGGPSPAPTPSAGPSASPSAAPSASPSPSVAPSESPSATATTT